MRNYSIFSLLIITYFSCSSLLAQYEGLNELEWLIGKWERRTNDNITIEFWHKAGDHTFEGFSETLRIATGEIVNYETLRIVEMSGEIFYIAKVSHNELPILFKLTESANSTFVFQNPSHDFPKKIEYKIVSKNEMLVTVGNKERGFKINFLKEE